MQQETAPLITAPGGNSAVSGRLNYDAHARIDAKISSEMALRDSWSMEAVRTMNCHA